MTDRARSQGRWSRRIGWWLVAALVVAGLYAAYRPRALPVEVATVSVGRFEQTLQEDGVLRLKQRYVMHAPMAGELLRPTLRVGDPVAAGDVIAELIPLAAPMIDDRSRQVLTQRLGSAEAGLRSAQAQVAQAQLALAQAREEARQARQLADQGFTAASTRDAAERRLQTAEEALASARAQQQVASFGVAEARAALSASLSTASGAGRWAMRSPVAGRVIRLHQDSAGPVAAGQAVLDIGNTDELEAVIDVLSSDVGQVRPGAAVRLSVGTTETMAGRVERVEPVAFTKVSALGIEEQRVNVVINLDQTVPDGWGDGYRVDATIQRYAEDQALIIPSGALVRQGSGWQVFVIDGDRARARAVEVRDRHATQAWVGNGLQAGETVVMFPGSLIQEGQRVRATPRP